MSGDTTRGRARAGDRTGSAEPLASARGLGPPPKRKRAKAQPTGGHEPLTERDDQVRTPRANPNAKLLRRTRPPDDPLPPPLMLEGAALAPSVAASIAQEAPMLLEIEDDPPDPPTERTPARARADAGGERVSQPDPPALPPPAPGKSAPGTSAPGTSAPSTSAPGTSAPGTSAPGKSAPSTSAPSTSAPGVSAPGVSAPGVSAPGVSAPGVSTPGAQGFPPLSPPPAPRPSWPSEARPLRSDVPAKLGGHTAVMRTADGLGSGDGAAARTGRWAERLSSFVPDVRVIVGTASGFVAGFFVAVVLVRYVSSPPEAPSELRAAPHLVNTARPERGVPGVDTPGDEATSAVASAATPAPADSPERDDDPADVEPGAAETANEPSVESDDFDALSDPSEADAFGESADETADTLVDQAQRVDGDVARAEQLYRRAITLDEGHAAAYIGLAQVLIQRRRYAEAADKARSAIRLRPRAPDYRVTLGDALFGRGDIEGARAAYRAALSLAPNHGRARRHLRRLP